MEISRCICYLGLVYHGIVLSLLQSIDGINFVSIAPARRHNNKSEAIRLALDPAVISLDSLSIRTDLSSSYIAISAKEVFVFCVLTFINGDHQMFLN
mmetsp:Transcript_21882/g.32464  ORF Transcript_21882/g.32464 Transcript_21882/m.32464 type:complete len:97 (-) Transcript_21882:93-383(-)